MGALPMERLRNGLPDAPVAPVMRALRPEISTGRIVLARVQAAKSQDAKEEDR